MEQKSISGKEGHLYFCKSSIFKQENLFFLLKNDCNGGIWQSGIPRSLAEYVQRCVFFVNVQSSLHENVVFSV